MGEETPPSSDQISFPFFFCAPAGVSLVGRSGVRLAFFFFFSFFHYRLVFSSWLCGILCVFVKDTTV